MRETHEKTRLRRITECGMLLCAALSFVYGILPMLTRSVEILDTMSVHIEENNIDPTRYYYTDVEQVVEAERYLHLALEDGR